MPSLFRPSGLWRGGSVSRASKALGENGTPGGIGEELHLDDDGSMNLSAGCVPAPRHSECYAFTICVG